MEGGEMREMPYSDVDGLTRATNERVSHAISKLEVALATWNSLERKPKKFAGNMKKMEMLLLALQDWERKSLENSGASQKKKAEHLARLVGLSGSFDEVLS